MALGFKRDEILKVRHVLFDFQPCAHEFRSNSYIK